MKINGVNPSKIVNLYGVKNKHNVEPKNKVNTKDSIEISEVGKSLSNLGDNSIPDTEKVESIKRQIQEGTYKVDSKEIAKKMMDVIKRKGI